MSDRCCPPDCCDGKTCVPCKGCDCCCCCCACYQEGKQCECTASCPCASNKE